MHQVGRELGHRAHLNGDSMTGGAENGTPGSLEREKGAAGRGSAGISGQVGRKIGHRARLSVERVRQGAVRPGGVQREMKMDRP
jgi:hypothetical protein